MIRVSLLGKYMSAKDSFRCIGDKQLISQGSLKFLRPRSYGMNTFFGWTPDRHTSPTYHQQPNALYKSFLTVGGTSRPSDFFVFGEIHPFSICQPQFGVHPMPTPTASPRVYHVPGNQHGQISQFAYADGHAAAKKWKSGRTNNPKRQETDGFWHSHETTLSGAEANEVKTDYWWLSEHATERR
jgi:prepilin-type processing-associated H-X9-DG protein